MIATNTKFLRVLGILAMWTYVGFGAQMQVEEPPEPGGGSSTKNIATTVFSFSGIGDIPPCFVGLEEVSKCQFLNDSDVDWNTLKLSIEPGSEPVFCGLQEFGFDSCTEQQGNALLPTVLTFSGGTGIPKGQILYFSGSGWPTTTTFTVAANVPEPASIAFMISGITAIGLLRRLRRRR